MEYNSFDKEMRKRFGGKVYRLSLSSGCTCPNRDGKCGNEGCIFCSEGASGEFAALPDDALQKQIDFAKKMVANKIRSDFAGYIAYYQSFSNTYVRSQDEFDHLKELYTNTVNLPEILAISIATRPDCITDEVLQMLKELSAIKPVWVELGLQTVNDETAELIGRGYKTDIYDKAVLRLHEAGIEVITHVIIGLPGENNDMIKETVRHIIECKSEGIKLQLLHVLKNTRLYKMILNGSLSIHNYSMEEYVLLVKELVAMLPPEMTVHRLTGDAPKKLLVSPLWSGDKKKVLNALKNC